MNFSELVELALDAARIGATELERHFGSELEINTKTSSADYVTNADLAAESAVRNFIRNNRPNDSITGEEFAADIDSSAEFRWCIDPLDGTVNFARGLDHFCTSVGVQNVATGEWVAGAIVAPILGDTYFATKGGGAYRIRNGVKKQLFGPPKDREARILATGFSYSAEKRIKQFEHLTTLMHEYVDLRRIGSAALDICHVAEGSIDAYIEADIKDHDWAAAAVIAEEAGLNVKRPEFSGDYCVVKLAI
jgi:myo-inositol-1(or 4)-monophosphatase